MTFTKEHQKIVLFSLIASIVLLNGYRFLNGEKPRTAPLAYTPGSVASSPVRHGLLSREAGADPLGIFIERRHERYPGVSRDIFRMVNPAPAPRSRPTPTVAVAPPPPPPPVPQRTPEEIAADLARADLAKFRFLGYLTDKENTLFLSKDGELFIVKGGSKLLQTYKVKEAGKDAVVLFDTATRVEVRLELSGDETQQQPQQQQMQRPQPLIQHAAPQQTIQQTAPLQPQQQASPLPEQPLTKQQQKIRNRRIQPQPQN
jgi:hypothetical protein